MIVEKEALEIISNEFPSISGDPSRKSFRNTIEPWVDFIKDSIQNGEVSKVNHCFRLAEKLLENGNLAVRNAIKIVFVYSVGRFVFFTSAQIPLSPIAPNNLRELFKGALLEEYYKQVGTSGD